ncbi:MAG: hypothetical protein NO474_04735 [Methanomassiliicoccales archaeon]|nr:hypothetical protein [Methanomassiliicoccales archaeon]
MDESVKKISESIFSKEVHNHLVRAGTEILLALDSMIPESKFPPEARRHYLAAKREFLLMIKSVIDANLEVIDNIQKRERSIKKIDVQ